MLAAHMDFEDPAHRDRVQPLLERAEHRRRAGTEGGRHVPAPSPTGASRRCGSWRPTRSIRCRRPTRVEAALEGLPVRRRLRHQWRRPTRSATPMCGCRPPAGARRTARSPIRSGASRASAPSCRAGRGAARLVDHQRSGEAHGFRRRFRLRLAGRDLRRACGTVGLRERRQRATSTSARYAAIDGRLRRARRRSNGRLRAQAAARQRTARSTMSLLRQWRFLYAGPQGALRCRPPDGRNARQPTGYPLVLNTGRVRDHWHTMTRTGKSPRLSQHHGRALRRNPPGRCHAILGSARLTSCACPAPMARLLVRALVAARQRARHACSHQCTGRISFRSKGRIDALVAPLTDPISGQPALKHVAVRIERFAAQAFGFAVLRDRPASIRPTTGRWPNARMAGASSLPLLVTALIGPALRNRCSALPKARRCLPTMIRKPANTAWRHSTATGWPGRYSSLRDPSQCHAPGPRNSWARCTTASAIASG